ncbi:DUF3413 domain-containing protein [Vibrio casei]|uniref:DUF3413 domain-containing protein n=1 Tax=Vibrio casei TaxID=673372 RepID=A0A368LNT1_9VIBR|nr:DUF3413 domain-containing protein [Vibrio casei]RCS73542.1 DUF3413 domain-containing protein [Vibrio casei]SJN25959.1 hydrolase of alkaline phosphatase superfamily [Vibrio casei]
MVDSDNSYGERVSRLVSWGHWFAFFNIILAMLIGTSFIAQSPWPETFLGQAYLIISWIGHFSFLVFALYILILFPLTFIIPSRKLLRLISVCFATICLTLLLLDSQAYQKLHLHLNPVVWELLLSKEKTSFNAEWQYLFAAVPVIFLLQLAISEWIWKKQRKLSRKQVGKPATIIFFLCFISSHLIYIWADAFFYNPITNQRANFPLSYPMTAKSFMEKHGLLDKEEYLERLEKNGNANEVVNYPLEPVQFEGRGKRYNVLMIMVDNLRSDMLTSEIMPATYQFAKNNQNFINHYSASNNTYGVFGLFYGLPSSYASSIKAQNTAPLFINTMHDRNYQMAAFSNDNFDNAEFYDEIFQPLDISPAQNKDKNTSDAQTVNEWSAWFSVISSKPWFSYIELSQVENFEDSPTILPKFQTKSSDPTDKLKARYQSAAYEADQSIQKIISEVDEKSGLSNTIIIITSNHGTEFNETQNNSWGSNSNFSRYQLQVPMVIHWPGKIPELFQHKTSHLDLSATLMKDLFESTSNPYDLGSGKNLFNTTSRPWILAGDSNNIALITDKTTTVVDQFGNYKVYDEDYKRSKRTKPKLSIVLQGLSELKRFYHQGD